MHTRHWLWATTLLACHYLTGCAYFVYSDRQLVSVATINDRFPEKTRCVLRNEEGLWKLIPTSQGFVYKDGNYLYVQCVNQQQAGHVYVPSSFDAGAFALDFFGLCLPCVLVDSYYNAFYSYPSFMTVMMTEKQDNNFIEPSLQYWNAKPSSPKSH